MSLASVCVFCGSNPGNRPTYAAAAIELGALLAQRGITLVYGGGNVGLMGRLADAALAAGGRVVGVIPEALLAKEVGHRGLSDLHVTRSMHERKAKMAELAAAFVALPGGFGTFEEFCEVVTWSQLGLHAKPCGLLDIGGYYAPLLAMFDRAVDDGFVRPAGRAIVVRAETPAAMLTALEAWRPTPAGKWLERPEQT